MIGLGVLKSRPVAVIAVAALQLIVLGFFVWDREHRVRHGVEVVLPVVPVDPRSLFQGDYVILSYDISTIEGYFNQLPEPGHELYVTIKPDGQGGWQYSRHRTYGDLGAVPGGVVLKGRVVSAHAAPGPNKGVVRLSFGLERFFVPEGEGKELEKLVRQKKVSAIVSVWRDGTSALKGLQGDGRVLFETGVAAKAPEEVPPMGDTVPPQQSSDNPQPAPQNQGSSISQ